MDKSLKDARILIIDDQAVNLEVLQTLLSIDGYTQVELLMDSTKAVEKIESFQPDLILLDLMMPEVNGYQILDYLSESNQLDGRLKVLVLTADATSEAKKLCLQKGAHDFLTKPFDIVETSLRIKNLLHASYFFGQLQNQNEVLEQKVQERTQHLKKSLEQIKHQNRVFKEIAWIQSHVVRAPVSRIFGLSNLLSMEEESDFTHADIIEKIVASCKELDQIIRNISKKTDEANIQDPDD